jgi:hypothetical protein
MLEVHPPHKAIKNLREFLYHLLTITCGLLIAVGIERFVEWRHHQHLLEDAREQIRIELEKNAQKIDRQVTKLAKSLADIRVALDTMAKIQRADAASLDHLDLDLSINTSSIRLSDTAWRTAQTTGAMSYATYEEAQRYGGIYGAQEHYMASQNVVTDDLAHCLGLVRKFDLLRPNADITPAQASDLAEAYGRYQVNLVLLQAYARVVSDQEHSFLENRPAQENYKMDLE